MRMTSGDLMCFSHLRWGFVFQRPNHLMVRFARHYRTFFVEEPIDAADDAAPSMDITPHPDGVIVCTPRLPRGRSAAEREQLQRELVQQLVRNHRIEPHVLWFYTPMALPLAAGMTASVVVYDCMDELSAFDGAPPELVERERHLFARADVIFTGGHSLYQAKRDKHPAVFAMPSSVDAGHFAKARQPVQDPADQAELPRPRLGFFGVIDERLDLELVAAIAEARPQWHLVMLGPVVKIDPARLPRRDNLHWFGSKSYAELPAYLASWDVAMMPFARNRSTEFISPTKTLEYLAAGRPVVSTAITDVVHPYGDEGLVRIADRPAEFIAAIAAALAEDPRPRIAAADACIARTSWDITFARMKERMASAAHRGRILEISAEEGASCSTI
ncbi:MAG: glycosyltransferase [Deltaproteobacteria bacterium]|nr:glycosyltransferase [Nannocystaceae bacterium]